eukprot:486998_1
MAELVVNQENELIKLFQINGKGWKLDLFENENQLTHVLCAHCSSICRDAVELGCDHDDVDIFLHCNDCLSELICNNNTNCPINNHLNPIIIPSRSTRRLISKSILLCPFSIQYKQKNNNYNCDQQIIDTNNSEQKEGLNEQTIKGCKFKGTIDDLLKNHISQCIQIYNPLYIQNIIVNKYKNKINQLQNKNNELHKAIMSHNKENEILNQRNIILENENSELNTVIISHKNEHKILSEQNKKLQNVNNELHKVIMSHTNENKSLKMKILHQENVINELGTKLMSNKHENRILTKQISQLTIRNQKITSTEEKKNAYDETWKEINLSNFWGKHGKKMVLNGNTLNTVSFDHDSLSDTDKYKFVYKNTIYSSFTLSQGKKHCIKIKVLNSGCCIGITSTNKHINSCGFGKNNKKIHYGYCSDGKIYTCGGYGDSWHRDIYHGASGVNKYDNDDIISVVVDLRFQNFEIFFLKNERIQRKMNIGQAKYFIAICMGYTPRVKSSIKLLSYTTK